MTALSDYLEAKLLDHSLGTTSYTMPTPKVALFTTATNDATGGTEVTGGSYARQAVTFSAASGGSTANTTTITFPAMPACTVSHAAIYDATTAGNRLYHAALTVSQTVAGGNAFTIAIGNLTLSLD